ncbi:MAG: hypothetical protein MHPSP_004296, partial [Paramarteilia canceri]
VNGIITSWNNLRISPLAQHLVEDGSVKVQVTANFSVFKATSGSIITASIVRITPNFIMLKINNKYSVMVSNEDFGPKNSTADYVVGQKCEVMIKESEFFNDDQVKLTGSILS